jgi:hypothetical protein
LVIFFYVVGSIYNKKLRILIFWIDKIGLDYNESLERGSSQDFEGSGSLGTD